MGMIRDLRSIAITLKDSPDLLESSRARVIAGFMGRATPEDDAYLFSVLSRLRGDMTATKLVPAGQVLAVNSEEHFSVDTRRMGAVEERSKDVRITVRDVGEVLGRRFGEIWFAKGMFSDHSPKCYEFCLEALRRGVKNNGTVSA
jgi:hypothetical protein